MKKIAVIGAGVNGLSAACKIAETFYNDAQVTLISDEISPNTTGDGSAGLWGPYLLGSTPDEKVVQWSKETHNFFRDLWVNGLAKECGISLIPCIRLSVKPEGFPTPSWSQVVFGYSTLEEEQLNQFRMEHSTPYTGGAQYVTFTAEPIALLPYLYKRFEKAGGKFERKKVFKFEELSKENYDMVINCTGVKAEQLAQDKEVTPIRGQVMRVKAPLMFQSVQADENYVIPNQASVVLGGTSQKGDYNLNTSEQDTEFILLGCSRMFPSLKNAPVIREWVGQRPGRTSVRLELDTKELQNGKTLTIVHNYGHAGAGVTLCWGCASDVTNLVQRSLKLQPIHKTKSKL